MPESLAERLRHVIHGVKTLHPLLVNPFEDLPGPECGGSLKEAIQKPEVYRSDILNLSRLFTYQIPARYLIISGVHQNDLILYSVSV